MGVRFPVRLQSVEDYVVQTHGEPRQLTADESLILFEYGFQIVGAIQDAWPVDTGLSQASWDFEVGTEPGNYHITITNDVPYVQYVHRKGQSEGTPLWRVLIPAVVRAFGPRLIADLRAAIDQTEAALRSDPDSLLSMLRQATRQVRL